MKKILSIFSLTLLLIFAMTLTTGAQQRHFDVDEAYSVGGGTWYSNSNRTYNLVYTYVHGTESTLDTTRGYTNPDGTSQIYFDYKGVDGCIIATYYPDSNTYYAALYAKMDGYNWQLMDNTLYKQR